MKSINIFENWQFYPKGPHADPLYVDKNGRAILFTLKPEQTIHEHNVPSSPFYMVILAGRGIFAGGDGLEQEIGANTLLVFEPGEQHTIRAVNDLVFIGFLHGAPGAQTKSPAPDQIDEKLG